MGLQLDHLHVTPDAFARATLGLAVACLLASSCGGGTSSQGEVQPLPGGGEASGPDYEERGVYRCCLQGQGTSCCEDAGPGMCFQYGGYYGDCRREGQVYEGKIICAHCCEGLTRASVVVPGDELPPEVDELPEGCDWGNAPDSIGVCIRCGDGICGEGESFCNCPEDCPRPDAGADAG